MAAQRQGEERYLVFDAGCSVCNSLAEEIADAAGGKLTPISIREEKAKALLDRACPDGWIRAPYLVVAGKGPVRAWTGLAAAARIATLIGPRKAWRIWSAAQRAGVRIPSGGSGTISTLASRRRLLKVGTAFAGAIGWTAFQQSRSIEPISAQPGPCEFYQCFSVDSWCTDPCSLGTYNGYINIIAYECWDGPYYCGMRYIENGCRC